MSKTALWYFKGIFALVVITGLMASCGGDRYDDFAGGGGDSGGGDSGDGDGGDSGDGDGGGGDNNTTVALADYAVFPTSFILNNGDYDTIYIEAPTAGSNSFTSTRVLPMEVVKSADNGTRIDLVVKNIRGEESQSLTAKVVDNHIEFTFDESIKTDVGMTLEAIGAGLTQTLAIEAVGELWQPFVSFEVQNRTGGVVSLPQQHGNGGVAQPSVQLLSLARNSTTEGDFSQVDPSGEFFLVFSHGDTPSNPDVHIQNTNENAFKTKLVKGNEGHQIYVLPNRVGEDATITITSVEDNTEVAVINVATTQMAIPSVEFMYLLADNANPGTLTISTYNIPKDATVALEEIGGNNFFHETTTPTTPIPMTDGAATFTLTPTYDHSTYPTGTETTIVATLYDADGTTKLRNTDGEIISTTSTAVLVGLYISNANIDTVPDGTCGFDAYPITIVGGYLKRFNTEGIIASISDIVLQEVADNTRTYASTVKRVELDADGKVTTDDEESDTSGALICLQEVEGGETVLEGGNAVFAVVPTPINGSFSIAETPHTIEAVDATDVTPTLQYLIESPEPLTQGDKVGIDIKRGAQVTEGEIITYDENKQEYKPAKYEFVLKFESIVDPDAIFKTPPHLPNFRPSSFDGPIEFEIAGDAVSGKTATFEVYLQRKKREFQEGHGFWTDVIDTNFIDDPVTITVTVK